MLQRIVDFFFYFKEYVVLGVCIVMATVLLVLNDNAQIRHVRAVVTVVFGVVEDQLSFIPSYIGLKSENEMLRRVNIELADEAARLREAKLENLRLRQMIGLKQITKYDLIPARVVNKNLTLLRNTITLDAGAADGVKMHMPVVSDGGLVGLVTNVSDHFAVVNLLVNVDFRSSVKIQRSRVDGILAWDGVSLVLKNVTKTLDVKQGDVVITSEYSRAFPAGIRVGVVSAVKDQPGSMFNAISITPGVDFVKLEEVFVMMYQPDEERADLEQRAAQRPGR